MRVMIMIGSFKTGGAERMSLNTGEALIKLGYDVYYVIQKPIFEIPNTIPREKIILLRQENRTDLFYKITALFIGVFKASRKIKPDVIIAFSRFSSFLACFTFHRRIYARFDMNPYELSKKQRIWANVVLNFPFVRKVIVPSSGMLKALGRAKPGFRHKLQVIPNSINESIVLTKSAAEKSPYTFDYIVGMGRLSQQKNFELLISAYAKSKIKEQYRLLIIGDGVLKEKLTQLIESFGLQDQIILTGQLANPFPVVGAAKLMVNTSSRESFCNVILEGLTLSIPVIATDCPYGPADMIQDGYNGYLIPNNHLNSLVSALDKIAEDKTVLDKFRRNAHPSMTPFTIDRVITQWVALIS